MKIEGNYDSAPSYSAPVEKISVQNTATPVQEKRTNNIQIKDYVNQNVGYQPTVQEKSIIDAIEKANKKILGPEKEFEFAIHKQTKQIMVKVLDKSTGETIREIPPEKVLDAVAQMCELAGLFMDEKR